MDNADLTEMGESSSLWTNAEPDTVTFPGTLSLSGPTSRLKIETRSDLSPQFFQENAESKLAF